MFKILKNNIIQLTRGDTARITVNVNNEVTEDSYEIDPADVLKLTVKCSCDDDTIAFQKVVTGSDKIHIEPMDTCNLDFGEYVYDVQLETVDGDIYTIITPSPFVIMEEVCCDV